MKKELIKKEAVYLLCLFLVGIVIFKILFYKENLFVVVRTVFALFWLFILPGFSIMCYWHEKLGFLERAFAGALMNAAIMGITSYYIGLLGLNIKYHGIILPLFFLIIGTLIIIKRK